MNIRELKKHLAELTKKELINEISFLFQRITCLQNFLRIWNILFLKNINSRLKFIQKQNLGKAFKARCRKIVDDTDGIGWGFHDQLGYLYDFYFLHS